MPRRYRSRSKRRVSRKSRRTKRKTKRRTKRITRRKKGGVKQKRQRQGRADVAAAAAAAAAAADVAAAAAAAPVAAPGEYSHHYDLTPLSAPAPRDEQQRIRREEAIDENTKWMTREQIDPVTGWGAHNNVMCGKFGCAFKTVVEGMGDEKDFTDEAGNEWPKRFREQKIKRRVGNDPPLSRERLLQMVPGLRYKRG